MPFLRVVRDKRGYETTYLIHEARDAGATTARLLYVFRSPGGVRVGRAALDVPLRRELEARFPDVRFEWETMLSGQQVIDAAPEPRRPRRRPQTPQDAQPAARAPEPPPQPRLQVPTAIEGDSPEVQMRFLAHWHGILCEQIPLRLAEGERRDTVMALAQRLNPAGWIDADEIASGLVQATDALERISRLLSKRRRRTRRGGQAVSSSDSEQAATQADEQEATGESSSESPQTDESA